MGLGASGGKMYGRKFVRTRDPREMMKIRA